MKIRVLTTGLIAGILMSLTALYPAISLIAPTTIPSLIRPIENELWHGIALMVSAAAAVFILLDFGIIAARIAGVTDWRFGAKAGAVAGLLVGVVTFVTILSPLLALDAFADIAHFQPHVDGELPSHAVISRYRDQMLRRPLDWMFTSLLVNAIVGAMSGALYGWRHKEDKPKKKESLGNYILAGGSPRQWLGENTHAMSVATLSGLALGVLISLANLELFNRLGEIGRDVVIGEAAFADMVYSPIATLSAWLLGGVVVWLIHNPHTRWRDRVGGVVLAYNVTIIPILLLTFRFVAYFLGLAPYIVVHQCLDPLSGELMLEEWILSDLLYIFGGQVLRPEFFGTLIFVMPWLLILLSLVFMGAFGLIQGVVFGPIIPLISPRPVDKACVIARRISRSEKEILPDIYNIFKTEEKAYDVLAHLANRTYRTQPEISQLAGYFHTLGTSDVPKEHALAVRGISEITAAHKEWRWARDFSMVFWALYEVLEARTLEDILEIKEPAEHTTTSLPAPIVKNVRLITEIIREIGKTERVNDLQTKAIFLENALKAISRAKEANLIEDKENLLASSPERSAVVVVMNHWQETIVDVLQRLKGRALINSNLECQTCPISAQVPLVYSIKNSGLNVAQGVQLRVRESADYHLVKNGHSDVFVDILPPGEAFEAHIPIVPREGVRRLRIEWEVLYDDAVDDKRTVEFADVMEFTDPDKPFKRVFPIPYGTGTPLKSDDVFVGRDEIFSFIQENLLGAHQNNAIILHLSLIHI